MSVPYITPVIDHAPDWGRIECQRDADSMSELLREANEHAERVHHLTRSFITATRPCDPNAIADFAPLTHDWQRSRPGARVKRAQTVGEVLFDALDTSSMRMAAAELLMRMAEARADGSDVQKLIERAAHEWADQHAE